MRTHGARWETKATRRLEARGAIKDEIVLADENRGAEAERANRVGDLSHVRRMELADLTRRQLQMLERHVHKFEARQEIIAERARRRLGFGHPRQIFPTTTTFHLQLIHKGRPQRQWRQVGMVSHVNLVKSLID